MFRTPSQGSENGSILLALMAALVIGSVVVLLFAATLTGQQQVRFDRSYSFAIHASDTAVQDALTRIGSLESAGFVTPGSADATIVVGPVSIENKLRYEYTATKVADDRWEVVAMGMSTDAEGRQRRVEAVIEPPPLIDFAAFAKTIGDFGGGNTADSYNYMTGVTDTGRGIVGSNGKILIANSATATGIDGVELHDFFDDPTDDTDDAQDDLETRIELGCATAECRAFHTLEEEGGKLSGLFQKPLVVDSWWIDASLAAGEDRNPASPYVRSASTSDEACNSTLTGLSGAVPESLAFKSDGSIVAAGTVIRGPTTPAQIPPGVYCAGPGGVSFETVSSYPKTIGIDSQYIDDGVVQDPVIVYTSGPISVDSQLELACNSDTLADPDVITDTITAVCPAPIAQRFQLYTSVVAASTSSTEVAIGNQAKVVGLIYALDANCGAAPSNASADLYGAVLCGALNNLGGWAFHFDEFSRQISTQDWTLTSWREEVGAGSTSF